MRSERVSAPAALYTLTTVVLHKETSETRDLPTPTNKLLRNDSELSFSYALLYKKSKIRRVRGCGESLLL